MSAPEIGDLAPSAKYALYILEQDGPLGRQELVEATGMAAGTLDHGLRQLVEAGMIEKRTDLEDNRRTVYEAVNPG